MEKCQCCCPFKANELIENYKIVKLKAAQDLKELIQKYFDEHPHIDKVNIYSESLFSNSIFIRRDGEITVKAYTSED